MEAVCQQQNCICFCLCLEKMLLGLFAWVVKQEFHYFSVRLWPEVEYQSVVLHCFCRQKTMKSISKCLTFSWSSENLSHCVYLVSHDWKHVPVLYCTPGSWVSLSVRPFCSFKCWWQGSLQGLSSRKVLQRSQWHNRLSLPDTVQMHHEPQYLPGMRNKPSLWQAGNPQCFL